METMGIEKPQKRKREKRWALWLIIRCDATLSLNGSPIVCVWSFFLEIIHWYNTFWQWHFYKINKLLFWSPMCMIMVGICWASVYWLSFFFLFFIPLLVTKVAWYGLILPFFYYIGQGFRNEWFLCDLIIYKALILVLFYNSLFVEYTSIGIILSCIFILATIDSRNNISIKYFKHHMIQYKVSYHSSN